MKTLKSGIGLLAIGLVVSDVVLAHGGGLDASGCHHNRKTGDYHCHRSSYSPSYTPSLPSYTPPASLGLLGSSPTPAATVLSYRDLGTSTEDREKIQALENKVAQLTAENTRLSAKVQEQSRPAENAKSCQTVVEQLKQEHEAKLQQATIKPAILKAQEPTPNQRETISLSNLDYTEQSNIHKVCFMAQGAADYNLCVQDQMNQLNDAPRLMD